MERFAEMEQRPRQKPRHVHLADPDARGDLGLPHVLEEPQSDDRLFPLGKAREKLVDDQSILRELEAHVLGPNAALQRARLEAGAQCVERRRPVGTTGVHRVEDVVSGDVEMEGDLGNTRGATELLRELVHGGAEAQIQLLALAWWANRPGSIAEVSLELTLDRCRREGRELDVSAGIEALDRLQQTDECNLNQIVERLSPVCESTRNVYREALVRLDELVANAPFTRSLILDELGSLCTSRVDTHARDAFYPGRRVQLKDTFPSTI